MIPIESIFLHSSANEMAHNSIKFYELKNSHPHEQVPEL